MAVGDVCFTACPRHGGRRRRALPPSGLAVARILGRFNILAARSISREMPEIDRPHSEAPHEVEELYARSRSRVSLPLGGRERIVSALLGGTFVALAAALALTASWQRSPSIGVVGTLVLAYGVLANVEFEIGPGSVIPTQLVFVPMLFLLPLGWVPIAVAAGYLGSLHADVIRGSRHRERALVLLCSCWYTIGPVAVLIVAGEGPPRWGR